MPQIDYSIRVEYGDGSPVENADVAVHYKVTFESDYTDENGWVSFSKDNIMNDGVNVTVYIDGQPAGEHWVEDGDSLTLSI
jgi:hypothetical protein